MAILPNELAIVGPLSEIAFGCLAQEGYTWSIVRAYEISTSPAPGAVDTNATQTMINSAAAGLPVDAYMVICRNSDAASQIDALFGGIDNSLFDYIWIKVEPNTTPGCSWSGYTAADSCAFLNSAISQAQNYKAAHKIGIFSTPNIWNKFFGTSCNIGGGQTKLWYADYTTDGQVDSTTSYNDFVSFGGWSAPDLKQVGGNVTITPLCGHSTWHAYIDQLYWQAPPV